MKKWYIWLVIATVILAFEPGKENKQMPTTTKQMLLNQLRSGTVNPRLYGAIQSLEPKTYPTELRYPTPQQEEPVMQTQTYATEPAPAPSLELATSPEWLAYLNALGLEEGQFRADIDRQRGVAQTLAAQQTGDITAEGPGQRRRIAGGLETRGMARSGQFIRSLAEQRAGEGRRQAGVQGSLTGSLSGLESSLAQRLIDIEARRAQQELQMRLAGYV